jgi:hypothetical protein
VVVVGVSPACRSTLVSFLAVFSIPPIPGPGYEYIGPSDSFDESDTCKCNTVTYSLLSACASCQGGTWLMYHHSSYCTFVNPHSHIRH